MKTTAKKMFKWVFGLTAVYLLVSFTMLPASGVELNIPISEETLFKAAMGGIGGGILAVIIIAIVFVLMLIKKGWAENVEKDSTTDPDIKTSTIKERTKLGHTTNTLETSTPESPSSESTAPKRTKEFEHDNAPADSVPTKKLFCTQCGIKNQSDARFCEKCGHAMHRDEGLG